MPRASTRSKHRTLAYAHYANRVRGERARQLERPEREGEDEPAAKRRCSPSWARLISKVFHADPLSCRECGGRLELVAYINDGFSIQRILDALGLSPPQQERPPPIREVIRVPVDEEGREVEVG